MNQTPSMNQKVFRAGFSVETVSIYLLCCGLSDAGTSISVKNLSQVWNSSQEALAKGLDELDEKKILFKTLPDREGNHIYQFTDSEEWAV